MKKKRLVALLIFFALPLGAYVGPGAGFAFIGSFFFIFIAFFLAFFNFLTFPVRALFRFIHRSRTMKHARFKRVLVIGFDGMDYNLFRRFQQQGNRFPHFEKIEKEGTFTPLWSSEPPISPVAWSTFATGVNPGKHNIFDFLSTDRHSYMPKLSCSEIFPPKRLLKLGKWQIPLSSPRIELMRKSQSFWKIVSRKGIYSAVWRVPYTFPPEKIYGTMLSGLGTPDLRGTQGTFTFYAEQGTENFDLSEGVFENLTSRGENSYRGVIKGPPHPFRKGNPPLQLSFELTVDAGGQKATLQIGREQITLKEKQLSPWQNLRFKAGLVSISGIAQWVLESSRPVRLYLSPIQIDPEKPAMPISQPRIFSVYLAKLLGSYATLGMAEDTWSVNEGILSEKTFCRQVWQSQAERENVFFNGLKKIRQGLVVQVFEATDRMQHMFWRYLPDSGSPSPRHSSDPDVQQAILKSYQLMDEFVGRLLPGLKKKDLLLLVSDHGFNSFNRGFHLNSWLHQEGYLVLHEGKKASGKWYADVDWSRSRAYGQGLNGIYLNLKGRESQGIVNSGKEAEALKKKIKEKLLKVIDKKTGQAPIQNAFLREDIYRGPYVENAPDIIVGYRTGYRVSWESAVNYVSSELFSDNTRAWSGDHAFTRDQVPGILFCNRKVSEKNPALLDIAPTVLAAFGIKIPGHIEGRDLKIN